MMIDRRRLIAGLATLPLGVAFAGTAAAQEITVRGITFKLTERDKAWLKRYCERRGFSEGTADYVECYETRAREILEMRARDRFYRPDAP